LEFRPKSNLAIPVNQVVTSRFGGFKIKSAKLIVFQPDNAEEYYGGTRETHFATTAVRALPYVRSETEGEVHPQHRTPVQEDASRPLPVSGQDVLPRELCPSCSEDPEESDQGPWRSLPPHLVLKLTFVCAGPYRGLWVAD
jgi:hypothetical protein